MTRSLLSNARVCGSAARRAARKAMKAVTPWLGMAVVGNAQRAPRGAGVLLIISMMLGAVLLHAPSAQACDIADRFVVTEEHLRANDYNDPTSQLAQDYRDWRRDDTATIEILGVYVYETVYTVEAGGDWSRGSLNVPKEIWGRWPDDTSPQMIAPEDRSGEPATNCGWGPAGRPVGTRAYFVVSTEQFADVSLGEGADAVLTAAFGSPDTAPRDLNREQELIAQLDASRRTNTGVFLAVGGVALVAAAAVMYASRRRRGAPPVD